MKEKLDKKKKIKIKNLFDGITISVDLYIDEDSIYSAKAVYKDGLYRLSARFGHKDIHYLFFEICQFIASQFYLSLSRKGHLKVNEL